MDGDGISISMRAAAPGGLAPLVSVVVPLAAGVSLPPSFLERLPPDMEVIVAQGGTRAASMNAGAALAGGNFLWFLHADTVLGADAVLRIRAAAGKASEEIAFFDLRFDGRAIMRVTDLGVRFRSRVLGLPFGDQALAMPAALFRRLGGYREDAPYGEDHLLVWRAHRTGVPVRPIGAAITTSAVKYRTRGWLRTTGRHLWLTLRQAWPEWRALRRERRAAARLHAGQASPAPRSR